MDILVCNGIVGKLLFDLNITEYVALLKQIKDSYKFRISNCSPWCNMFTNICEKLWNILKK